MQLIAAQAEKDGVEKDPDVAAQLARAAHADPGGRRVAEVPEGQRTDGCGTACRIRYAIAAMDKTEYHAAHILVPTKEKAEQLIKKIKGGAKFEDVAKAESTDNSKANGGDSVGSRPRAWSSRSAMP